MKAKQCNGKIKVEALGKDYIFDNDGLIIKTKENYSLDELRQKLINDLMDMYDYNEVSVEIMKLLFK